MLHYLNIPHYVNVPNYRNVPRYILVIMFLKSPLPVTVSQTFPPFYDLDSLEEYWLDIVKCPYIMTNLLFLQLGAIGLFETTDAMCCFHLVSSDELDMDVIYDC